MRTSSWFRSAVVLATLVVGAGCGGTKGDAAGGGTIGDAGTLGDEPTGSARRPGPPGVQVGDAAEPAGGTPGAADAAGAPADVAAGARDAPSASGDTAAMADVAGMEAPAPRPGLGALHY
jgi:hypothetical protein